MAKARRIGHSRKFELVSASRELKCVRRVFPQLIPIDSVREIPISEPGSRTIRVNGEMCQEGSIYVDPSGFVIHDGVKFNGRHENERKNS
jgi:hypothetical protein